LVVRVGRGRRDTRASLARRVRKFLPKLSKHVVTKMVSRKHSSLKRVSNVVEAIKDALMLSTPEISREVSGMPSYQKLIHWAYSLGAHRTDRVTTEWKKACALWKWAALRSETEPPPLPRDFPGYGHGWVSPTVLPPLWKELTPWLARVVEFGVETKSDATRLLHLCTSRSHPAGDAVTRRQSLEKFEETVFSRHECTETRSEILRRLSYFIGRQCFETWTAAGGRSQGHISLTSSASLDVTVRQGGRAAEIGAKFRAWASHVADQDVLETTWFGAPYWLKAGRPRWQTMCRSDLKHELHHEVGESDDRVNLDFEDFRHEDPLFGIDVHTGKQLLQWAIEEGIRQDILVGHQFWQPGQRLSLGPNRPSMRAATIGEPGAKSRVVTVAEDWVTELLQPWAHHVIGALRTHPSAAAGLTRGWQLFEWVKAQGNSAAPPRNNRYFLSSDLTTATDFCTHEYSLAMLEGFHRGIERDSDPFFDLCARLLCTGRVLEGEPHLPRTHESITSRGILMGDPGTKAVLTLHNLCAETEALLRHISGNTDASDREFLYYLNNKHSGPPLVKWRNFACSGDDHFGQGPREYLSCITRLHAKNGMSVSWSQNFLSSRGGFYCEEMLLTVGLEDTDVWGRKVPLRDVPYLKQPHIDAMKVRLLSPCAKEHEGKDEPNPAIGKARQMHGMLAWLGGGWERIVPLVSARWEQRMTAYLPASLALRYLPVKLGGLEAPAFHRSKTEVRDALRSLGGEHLWAIKQVIDGTATPVLSRVLATFASNAAARGISSDLIEDQIREMLTLPDLTRGVTKDGLLERVRKYLRSETEEEVQLEWSNLRYKDRAALAKRAGLIDVQEAIALVGRPYLFRDILFPEISLRHGIDPYRSNRYESVPWEARWCKFAENLRWNLPTDRPELTPDQVEDTIQRITEWCVENKSLDIPREEYFFPERVVVGENLATLRVPL